MATVAAAAAGLVPVIVAPTPAFAAAADNLTISESATWEGNNLVVKITYTGSVGASFDLIATPQNAGQFKGVGGDSTAISAAAGNGNVDYNNNGAMTDGPDTDTDTDTDGAGPDTDTDSDTDYDPLTISFNASSVSNPGVYTLTLPTVNDTDVLDETFTITATNTAITGGAADASTKTATQTIWASATNAWPTFTLLAPTTVSEAVTSTGAQRTATVTAVLSRVMEHDVTIPIEAIAGTRGTASLNAVSTGTTNRDFTALATTAAIVIPASQQSGSVDISIWDDNVDEADTQYFIVQPTSGGTLAGVTQSGSTASVEIGITDNDATPVVTIGNAESVNEGAPLSFPVTLSSASELPVTVPFTTASGDATDTAAGAVGGAGGDTARDFTTNSTPIVIPAYNKTYNQLIATYDDSKLEGPETAKAVISGPVTNGVLGTTTTGSGTILDNESGPNVVLDTDTNTAIPNGSTITGEAVFAEGNSSEAVKNIQVTIGVAPHTVGPWDIPVRVDYKFEGGTATLGTDYKAASGSLLIPAGTNSLTTNIPVTIYGDTLAEQPSETFNLVLSSPNNSVATGSLGNRTFTITDDDTVPTFAVGDASVDEGNTGTATAKVPVTLSAPTNADVSFTATFAAGSPAAADLGTEAGDNDYDAPAVRTVKIPAGQTTGVFEFPVNSDTVFEKDEQVAVTLTPTSTTNVNGSTPTAGGSFTGKLTIKNDDASPKLVFNDASGSEGTSLRVLGKIVGKSQTAYDLKFTVDSTGPNAATATADYDVPTIAPINIARGFEGDLTTPLVSQLYLAPDNIDEPTETFNVTAIESTSSPIGIANSVGTFKINDDPGDLPPSASIRDESIGENEGSVDVHVDFTPNGDATESTQTILIPWETADGDAKKGDDYEYGKGVLTITPGTKQAKINVEIIDDKLKENEESFYVKLGTPTTPGATVTTSVGEVTIKSDDTASPVTPTLSVSGPARGVGLAKFMGTAAPNTNVELWGSPLPNTDPTKMEQLTDVNSDDDGYFEFDPRSIASGWAFVVRSQEINSATKIVKVTQLPSFSASSPKKGQLSVSVAGNPRHADQAVTVQRYTGGKWVTVGKGTTGEAGWKGTFKFKSKTKLTLRAYVAGDAAAGINAGYSSQKKVTVK